MDLKYLCVHMKSMYESLLEENILYATMPASFENRGQRIRLVKDVVALGWRDWCCEGRYVDVGVSELCHHLAKLLPLDEWLVTLNI